MQNEFGDNANLNKSDSSVVIGSRKNMSVLDRCKSKAGGVIVEVLQYDKLIGSTNTHAAETMYFMDRENIKARQLAVYISDDSVKVEPGAMSYFKGNLEMVSGVTLGNAVGRMFSGMLTGEKIAMPEYKGSGVLVLEPSFKHFITIELDPGETIVVDKGMFFMAQGSVTVRPILNSQISGALLGGEGIFQLEMVGPGLVVMESPVPMDEISIIHLDNDVLRVDGNFALLRTGNIGFTVERSARTLIGSAISGEGLVNVFRGTGDVWIAPTLKIYNAINLANTFGGDISGVDMNTSTGRARLK